MTVPPSVSVPRIEAAAIVFGTAVWTGVPGVERHLDILQRFIAATGKTGLSGEQGFLDSRGQFLSRRRARGVALAAGQLLPRASQGPDLFTEDVW